MVTAAMTLRYDGPLFFLSRSPPKVMGLAVCDAAHIILRKSHGFSCSRSSYSRAIGRIACSATM